MILLWCCLGSVEHGRAGCPECDKGYTSLYAMLKISALSEVGASWRLHGGVRRYNPQRFPHTSSVPKWRNR
ncbi:hypothetical protein FTV91_06090 [Escherichia coli]|nr:hypothetical protein FTV91_06090 [Escherichia coli]